MLVGHRHYRDLYCHITKKDEQARKDQKEEPYYRPVSHEQQCQTTQPEKRGEEHRPKEYDPMESSLVENLFAKDKIALDVAHVTSVLTCPSILPTEKAAVLTLLRIIPM